MKKLGINKNGFRAIQGIRQANMTGLVIVTGSGNKIWGFGVVQIRAEIMEVSKVEIYSKRHPTPFKKPPSPMGGTLFEPFGVAFYSGSSLCCVFVQAECCGWSFIRNTFLRPRGRPSIVGKNLMICFKIILSKTIGLPETKKR